jgi:hypothetical protein
VSSAFRIDYVEAALLQLLQTVMPAAYGTELGSEGPAAVNIDSLGDDDFDEDGQLVLQPPSLRVRFRDDPYNPARDNQRLTYQSHQSYEILCFESSLRSKADQRKQTLVLVSVVLDQLAGARISLADSSKTFPVSVLGVTRVDADGGPVDQLFSILVDIEGFAQFSGVNANRN